MIPKGPWVVWEPWCEMFSDYETEAAARAYIAEDRTEDSGPYYLLNLVDSWGKP